MIFGDLTGDSLQGFNLGFEFQDPFQIMSMIVKNLDMPAAIRPMVWPTAIGKFFDGISPDENPFWILFGYDFQQKAWRSLPYNYLEAPDFKAMKEQCRTLLELVRPIDSTSWAMPYRVKWQAFLQALHNLEQGVFPCLPMVAWAWIKGLGFVEHIDKEPFQPDRVWSIPCFDNVHNHFYQPARDFLKAFMAFLQKAGILTQVAVPCSPPVQAVMEMAPPDLKHHNLQKISAWLLQGKCPVTTSTFKIYDGIVPFFKDDDVLNDELGTLEGEVFRLLSADPFRLAGSGEGKTYYAGALMDFILVTSRPFDHATGCLTLMVEKLVKDKKMSMGTKFEPEEKTTILTPRGEDGLEAHPTSITTTTADYYYH